MDTKSWSTLELPKILDRLAAHTSFGAGAALAKALRPTDDAVLARRRLAETTEARVLLATDADLSLGGARDVRAHVEAALRAALLPATDLLEVRDTLVAARVLKRTLVRGERRSLCPQLAEHADQLEECPALVNEINRCLNDKGEVVDSASERLANVRREARIAFERLHEKLQNILTNSRNAPYLQEALLIQRNGRWVIPLRSEFKGRIPGIVHDQSQSGATLFIEPLSTVELNNRVRELAIEEEQEVERILRALGALVADHAHAINRTVLALAALDLAFAKAKYAEALRATEPELHPFEAPRPLELKHHPELAAEGAPERVPMQAPEGALHPGVTLRLMEARHPLLNPETVVPVDVVLDPQTFIIVITGPNTGGKTVSLKTVGLLALMAQSGLHIPAGQGSILTVFENVFADIGDEQSIEQSLSTFSSHMTNVVRILRHATSRSLVILDELGAGTDPVEGAALARAVLGHLLARGVTTFVATHYAELKAFAHQMPGLVNASVEFDLDTLAPTYRLTIGLPGRSNAFAIASRLGLPREIVGAAREMVSAGDLHAEDLLNQIAKANEQARNARAEAQRDRREAERLRRDLTRRLDHIEEERQRVLEQARREGQAEVEGVRAEIREMRRQISMAGLALDHMDEIDAGARALDERLEEPVAGPSQLEAPPEVTPPPAWHVGSSVWVPSLRAAGEIVALDGDEAEVRLGRLRVRVAADELRPPAGGEEDVPPELAGRRVSRRVRRALAERPDDDAGGLRPLDVSPGLELDLRGQTVDEALASLSRYLDAAFRAGLPWARVIHGKGTGALRQAVRAELTGHPLVHGFEAGKENEGGDGVTVVRLLPLE